MLDFNIKSFFYPNTVNRAYFERKSTYLPEILIQYLESAYLKQVVAPNKYQFLHFVSIIRVYSNKYPKFNA